MTTIRKWPKISKSLTSDGSAVGVIEVDSVAGLYVSQKVSLRSDTQLELLGLQVVEILSITSVRLAKVLKDQKIEKQDLSAYTSADNALILAPEQKMSNVDYTDAVQGTFERFPVDAWRTISVNSKGKLNSPEDPVYVQLSDGSINIGTVNANIKVQLSHKDNVPTAGDVADKVQVGDEETIAKVDVKNRSWSMNRYEKILPLLANANWLKLVNYEEVTTIFAGDVATLSYLQNGNTVAKAIFTFATDIDWSFKLESYINDDDGSLLLDDDGSQLFLD